MGFAAVQFGGLLGLDLKYITLYTSRRLESMMEQEVISEADATLGLCVYVCVRVPFQFIRCI